MLGNLGRYYQPSYSTGVGGIDDAYSETSMTWKLVRCVQQQWRIVYGLGSNLLSNAFRLALMKLTLFGPKDQLLLQDRMSVFWGHAAKSS